MLKPVISLQHILPFAINIHVFAFAMSLNYEDKSEDQDREAGNPTHQIVDQVCLNIGHVRLLYFLAE